MHKALKYNWLLFLIYPALAGIVSLTQYRSPWAKNILWAFVVFFGFTFAISNESTNSDINRYIEQYTSLYGKSMTVDGTIKYYEKSDELDILRPLLAIVLSRVSNHPALLTTVYALIFGFFYSRNIFYLMGKLEGKLSRWTWLLIIIFTLIAPFWLINGFRFWTATHMFLYGVLPYLYESDRKRLVFVPLSMLVHFSFVIPLASVITFFFVPKRLWLLIIVFLATVVYNEINVQWIANYVEQTKEEKVIERANPYIDKERVEKFRQGELRGKQLNWYARMYHKGINYLVLISFVVIYYLETRKGVLTKGLYMTYAFALWFYSFANVLSTIPSGGRFLIIAQLLAFFIIIVLFQNYYRKIFQQVLFPVFLPAMLLFIIVSVRGGFYFLSVSTVMGNLFTAAYNIEEHIALNDLIK